MSSKRGRWRKLASGSKQHFGITEFEKKSENGKIPLIIQAKDSEKTRLVELQFSEPAAQPKPEVPSTPAVESAKEEAGLAAGGALRSVEP
jgi:hypothetical protein